MYHLFLDDERMPQQVTWVVLPYMEKSEPNAYWHIVRSYNEFVDCIQSKGLPSFISFDHDLGDVGENEKSGFSCAKWLVDYCLDNNVFCPEFQVHSKNPQGASNISGLLMGFQQFQTTKKHKVKP